MNKLVLFLIIFLGLLAPVFFVSASTSGYAWSNNIGWINFGCDHCNFTVSSTAVTGYAWSDNYGWINFGPATYISVTNNGSGVLSGSAWGENTGWINFSGVTINSSGEFNGTASGGVVGTIAFTNCGTSCGVTTDWRPSGSAYCGDGICNGDETCSTCPDDCGACGGGGSHYICNAQRQCVSVAYSGTDQCSSDSDCAVHNECDTQTHQCVSVSGSGADECQTSNDCATHNECNTQKQCVQITGQPAPDQCQTNTDCNLTHTECNGPIIYCRYNGCTGIKCIQVSGLGSDQCNTDGDCTGGVHNVCNSQNQCTLVDGMGSNSCLTDNDCNATYGLCENNKCVQENGIGTSQCQTDADCQTPAPGSSHNECNDNKCIQVSGSGIDLCQTDNDCNVSHSECQQNQCVQVSGIGVSQCQTDADCLTAKHNECNSQNQCVSVNGEGFDQCQTDDNCNLSYNECEGNQCVQVSGIGVSQCQTDADCLTAKHNECNSQNQCVSVSGEGQDSCQTDADCGVIVSYHNECNSQGQCVSTVGPGADQCGTSSDCMPMNPGNSTHNECNSQNQCVSVNGSGPDKCQSNNDCGIINIITNPVKTIETITKAVEEQIPEPVKAVAEQTKKIVNTPQVSVITKTVSTTGIVVATAAAAAPLFSFSFFEIFLLPLRLFGLLMTALGFRKKVLPWGVVYDSITKRPLDPAYVVLKNLQGQTVSSAITDLDGRYGFLVEPGTYQMQALKTNYKFPSQKLAGKTHDELHADLYFGENIEIKTLGEVIIKNIPLDPLKFDWNEFAKKNKNLMKFYSKWDIVLRKVYDYFFVIGFIVAVIAYVFAPYPYNAVIIILYVLSLLLRIFGLKPRTYGYITDKTTGMPLSFAIVRVMMPGSNIEVSSKSADKYGKYYCLVPPGKYYVTIEKKNEDGSYALVCTSPTIDVSKKGIIKKTFKI